MIFIKTLQKIEIRFDTSNYDLDRALSKGKVKKVIGLVKDELSEKINGNEAKKGKGTKKCIIKTKLKF